MKFHNTTYLCYFRLTLGQLRLIHMLRLSQKLKKPQVRKVGFKDGFQVTWIFSWIVSTFQYLRNIVFSRRSIWVSLDLVGRWTHYFTKIDHKTRNIGQIYIWNSMTSRFIIKTLLCVISMEFLPLSRRRSSPQNVPSGEERGETDVFAG